MVAKAKAVLFKPVNSLAMISASYSITLASIILGKTIQVMLPNKLKLGTTFVTEMNDWQAMAIAATLKDGVEMIIFKWTHL